MIDLCTRSSYFFCLVADKQKIEKNEHERRSIFFLNQSGRLEKNIEKIELSPLIYAYSKISNFTSFQ